MPNLSRLVFVSAAALSAKDLTQWVAIQRRDNELAGVTGLVVAGAGQIALVLEGELADVADRFDEVRTDRRLHNGRRISFDFSQERLFPSSPMSFLNADANPDTRVRFVELTRLARALPGSGVGREVLALLSEFKTRMLHGAPVALRAAG